MPVQYVYGNKVAADAEAARLQARQDSKYNHYYVSEEEVH